MSKETNKKTTNKKTEKVVKENNNKTKSKDTKKEIKKDTKKVVKKEERKNPKKENNKKEIIQEEKKDIKVINEIEEENDEFDYDLEDFEKEEEIEEEIIVTKKDKEKAKKLKEEKKAKRKEEKAKKKAEKAKLKEEKRNQKEESFNEKKQKISKIAKEKNKTRKNKNSKLIKIGNFLENNRYIIASFIIGVILTTLVAFVIWPERIATLKNGEEPIVKVGKNTYTADNLYTQMKNHYNVSQLLDQIDNDLLTKLYPENKEMTNEVKQNAEYYINMYKQYYNYTEEQFLSSNGFATYNDFLEYLKLDYRRKKYLDKYVKDNLTDKEIENYYKKNVYGDINCQHILVETSSEEDSKKLKDEDGKKLAEEIISKINDGTKWEDVKKEYKDKVTFEDLGYQSWDSDLEDSFKTALKEMSDNSYSKEPVKTSYGYHVIYRLDQKKVASLEKTKDKIVSKLIEEKKSADSNLQYKALINLRKEKKIKFYDTDMESKYNAYIKQYK